MLAEHRQQLHFRNFTLPATSRTRFSWLAWCLAIWLVGCSAIQHGDREGSSADATPVAAIVAQLDTGSPLATGLDLERLREFYAGRNYRPAWHDSATGEPLAGAAELEGAIADSERHGLYPASYHLSRLRSLGTARDPEQRAARDLLLTDALLRYATHLYQGRTRPADVDPNWHIESDPLDAITFLQHSLEGGPLSAALDTLAPQRPEYRQLLDTLARYRQLAAVGGWNTVPPGPLLRPGDHCPRVTALRRRLAAEGFLPEGPIETPATFDSALESAVRQFQHHHTLEEDGLVGPRTLAALNTPVETRIAQIELNMERWRWLPHRLGERYLIVNMAGFQLRGYAGESRLLSARVIVGNPYRSTPAFAAKLTHVVTNPYWNVPLNIAQKDLIPAQLKDPDYLHSRAIRVLENWEPDAIELDPATLDWASFRSRGFPYRLRQDPGPQNALGHVKFVMDNPFSIYLHDTPQRHLFERAERTFSSGCIRVQHPLGLALFLFGSEAALERAGVSALIDDGVTRQVALPQPVPVYLVYLTTWVEDGELYFADDIYTRDAGLAARLLKLPSPLAPETCVK